MLQFISHCQQALLHYWLQILLTCTRLSHFSWFYTVQFQLAFTIITCLTVQSEPSKSWLSSITNTMTIISCCLDNKHKYIFFCWGYRKIRFLSLDTSVYALRTACWKCRQECLWCLPLLNTPGAWSLLNSALDWFLYSAQQLSSTEPHASFIATLDYRSCCFPALIHWYQCVCSILRKIISYVSEVIATMIWLLAITCNPVKTYSLLAELW